MQILNAILPILVLAFIAGIAKLCFADAISEMNTEFLKLFGFGEQYVSSPRLIRVSGATLLIGSVVVLVVALFLK